VQSQDSEETDLIASLRRLGLVAQVSSGDALVTHLAEPRTVYCGFDPTADSLHVGNLVPLLALRRFQLAGHRPILLVGGATGMIGDPGGKDAERQLNPAETVAGYVDAIREQVIRFLDFDDPKAPAVMVNNMDWTRSLGVIDFLRDVGKHFSVNQMAQKESVKKRLADDGSGISYTEFSYMVLQSYDFAVLNRDYGCSVQIGGSDQWGNITYGIELIRRMFSREAFAMTFPLLLNRNGQKFGKSEGGAVWLDPLKTSPYMFYQFWKNVDDAQVVDHLRIFTLLEWEVLEQLRAAHEQDPGARTAHTALARELTRLVHGDDAREGAERITGALFGNNVESLSESDFAQLALDGLPSSELPAGPLSEALVESGLAKTSLGKVTLGQARKLIAGNSIAVNGAKVGEDVTLDRSNARFGRYHLLKSGKKNHHLVVLAQ
jgi:tyrosyl-tRNA synthetase